MASVPSQAPKAIHRDRHFLIVYKPAGLPTTVPDRSQPSLTGWANALLGDRRHAHPSSRLDAWVSGLVSFTLTPRANRHLLAARRNGQYERAYIGLTTSDLAGAPCDWTWPISIDPRDRKRRVAGPGRGERLAHTRCARVIAAPHGNVLHLLPRTGRTHQLRAHAARAGAPLFGDVLYGGSRRCVLPDGRVITARRVMLQCVEVRFPRLEGDGQAVYSVSPDPDLEEAWRALGGETAALAAQRDSSVPSASETGASILS